MVGAGIEAVYDAGRLRAALYELRVMHALLSQFGEMAAGMPDVELERAAGIGASAAVVMRRIQQVQARLEQVTAGQERAGVVVLDPERGSWLEMPFGDTVLPLVTASRVDGVLGVCSGVSRLAAGRSSGVRVYQDVDVIMVVLFGGAVLDWWDSELRPNQVMCRRHQHAHIPRGTPYAVSNPGSVPMLAVLAHSGAELTAGAERVAELDHQVAVSRYVPGKAGMRPGGTGRASQSM